MHDPMCDLTNRPFNAGCDGRAPAEFCADLFASQPGRLYRMTIW